MYQTGLSFNLTIMLEFQKNNNNYKNLNKKEWVSLCLSCVAIVHHLKLHLKLGVAIWQLILHIYYPKKKKLFIYNYVIVSGSGCTGNLNAKPDI